MSKRWEIAQRVEPEHWLKNKDGIEAVEYRKEIAHRAHRLEGLMRSHIQIQHDTQLLEIGGGATQLVDFFSQGKKSAADPLADIYLREFKKVLNEDVEWHKCKAEALPFPDDQFDVVISRNALDHVDSVEAVLSEVYRVLKEGGFFYCGVNTFSSLLYVYKSIHRDKEHPYTWSHTALHNLLKKSPFAVQQVILDAPENTSHFNDAMSNAGWRACARRLFLCMDCYHFSEFILVKP